jgi:glycerol transport system substrate-binding protein
MKLGYQDAGAWTLLKSTPLKRRQAAWLYAQFVVAKTVSLKKTLVGLTPIRDSDLRSDAMTEAAPRLGGLVEFYRSPARVAWTPTGTNVPDYPKLAQLWWPNVANAVSGEVTPQAAMDTLAEQTDAVLSRLQRIGIQGECGPELNPEVDPEEWLARPGSPKAQLANEKPPGQTVPYDQLIDAWRAGRAS